LYLYKLETRVKKGTFKNHVKNYEIIKAENILEMELCKTTSVTIVTWYSKNDVLNYYFELTSLYDGKINQILLKNLILN